MLKIHDAVAGGCMLAAIEALSSHKGPEDALAKLCADTLDKKRGKYAWLTHSKDDVYRMETFYVFSSGAPDEPIGGFDKKNKWFQWKNYGEEFADFLTDNGLGEIVTMSGKNNRYMNGNKCAVWLWKPNEDAVVEWWRTHKPKPKPVAKRVRNPKV